MNKIIIPAIAFFFFSSFVYGNDKIVIAKNGAAQDLIEYTLPAITLAAAHGVDHLELHINMTSDDQLVLFKDTTLDRISDAAKVFPQRHREDGHHYVVDFTLSELRQLRLKNVFEDDPRALSLSIPTLQETLNLIQALETILDQSINLCIEIVEPQFYRERGKDISISLLETLDLAGYADKYSNKGKVFLQCYDADELQRIHETLLPSQNMSYPIIQLVRHEDDTREAPPKQDVVKLTETSWLFTNIGLRFTASYATALALPEKLLFSRSGTSLLDTYLQEAHKYGLMLLVYGADESNSIPENTNNLQQRLEQYNQAGLDGVYTDNHLETRQLYQKIADRKKRQSELPEFFSNLNLAAPQKTNSLTPTLEPEVKPED